MNGDFVRGRMFNTALLARIHAKNGDVDQACAIASEAVDLSEDLRSGRSRRYVHDLERQLAPHSAVAAVAQLQDKIRNLRSTV